jgi:4'-phosphopantetheinyl transferase
MSDKEMIWVAPPPHLTLPLDEVHVWRGRLDLPAHTLHQFQRALSPDEIGRANRFVFEKDRRHFIAGRGLLRHILSRYLQVAPAEIEFSYSEFGKPELSPPSSLRFNVSHSGGLALYAVGHHRKVGVDIEEMRSNIEFIDLAQSFFSPLECAMLHSVPDDLVQQAFFNCWTRKEAYMKATGDGLSLPLQCFDVSLIPGEAAALIELRHSRQEASQWSMQELCPGPEFAAALVVEGKGWRPRFWQWPAGNSV